RRAETGEDQLVAFVVSKQEPAPSSQELRHFLEQRVPAYLIPATISFLRTLPLTSNGKVDRQNLPQPQESNDQIGMACLEPRNPIEEVLMGIWKDILNVKSMSVHDDFASLGGHSLLATRVISRIRSVLQVDIPLQSLFDAPTIAGLSVHVE